MSGRIRCAIYTRKSSEEGLEQSFNSLQAQREACEAYIVSQRHEGWHAISTRYDDGGFSGGNLERPALQNLFTDIETGKIDTVVVYKVDRLTRSLADFAKIIEIFDAKHVSFVSVTQQFNTTTSMGRLTLNVLLSFAQFEREVTGERIRDKIAASKKKGMWMGGPVPLGYDLKNRKLMVNEDEASRVREIYRQYLRLGCVSLLKEYLDQSSVRSKVRVNAEKGTKIGGQPFSRGALYQLLKNHLYIGEIAHKGQVYPGEHEAIIEREIWGKVQRSLVEHRQGTRRRTRVTKDSLLTGILFDHQGNRYTPTHAVKRGRRYRYYTSQAVIRKKKHDVPLARIPAQELEIAVTGRVLALLHSPEEVIAAANELSLQEGQLRSIVNQASQKATVWEKLAPPEKERFLQGVLHKVVVQEESLQISIELRAFFEAIQGRTADTAPKQRHKDRAHRAQVLTLRCPFQQARRGVELRLIVDGNKIAATTSSTALIKAIVRARCWYERLVSGRAAGIAQLSMQDGVTAHYVKKLFPCALLNPRLVEKIINQQHSPSLTLDKLVTKLPLEWDRQDKIVLESARHVATRTGS